MDYSKSRRLHDTGLAIAIILSFLFFVFIVVKDYLNYRGEVRTFQAVAVDSMSERLDGSAQRLSDNYRQIGRDMVFLSHDLVSNQKPQQLGSSVNQNKAYLGFAVMTADGKIQTRSGGMIDSQMFNGDYLSRIFTLEDGEVFLFSNSAKSEPVYYAFARIPDSKEIVIASIDPDYLFSEIKQFRHQEESVYLVDHKGAPLISTQSAATKTSMELPSKILDARIDQGSTEDDRLVYAYKKIYPTLASHELYLGAQRIYTNAYNGSYDSLLLAISSDKTDLYRATQDAQRDFHLTVILSALIAVSVAAAQLVARRSFTLAVKRK